MKATAMSRFLFDTGDDSHVIGDLSMLSTNTNGVLVKHALVFRVHWTIFLSLGLEIDCPQEIRKQGYGYKKALGLLWFNFNYLTHFVLPIKSLNQFLRLALNTQKWKCIKFLGLISNSNHWEVADENIVDDLMNQHN